MSEIDISVMMATRARPRLLAETLRSLAAMDTTGLRWELVVIDNGPDRATQAVVGHAAPGLPVRRLTEAAAGKNHALNQGLRVIAGDLVVLTDDDVVVERDWLVELWAGAARWPDASMFGGRVLARWPSAHAVPEAHPFFEHAYAIADFAHPEGPYSSGYVYGPNMAIRASVFAAGWRFNPYIGPDGTGRYISGSETSLTVALERSGHRAVYLPRALVHHQIREEQLTPRWLYGRAFRQGRADAFRRGVAGGWREVPREILRTARREYALWLRCRLRGDRRGTLDHGLAYWRARGVIHHCRVSLEPAAPSARAAPRFGS